ncbi:MAG: hypothetical protein OXD46_10525 [Chloroflexi bacterium]|nr:hypothetical protein [Chloroflexota bacterium]
MKASRVCEREIIVFAVDVDYPTYLTRIHEWPNGNPRFPQCRPGEKSPAAGEWRHFTTVEEALYFARQTNLEIAHCQHCNPALAGWAP